MILLLDKIAQHLVFVGRMLDVAAYFWVRLLRCWTLGKFAVWSTGATILRFFEHILWIRSFNSCVMLKVIWIKMRSNFYTTFFLEYKLNISNLILILIAIANYQVRLYVWLIRLSIYMVVELTNRFTFFVLHFIYNKTIYLILTKF